MLHAKPHNNIFNYFQRTPYSELIMFWYYTLQTKNFTRAIEKLKMAHLGYLFSEEYTKQIGTKNILVRKNAWNVKHARRETSFHSYILQKFDEILKLLNHFVI